MVEYRRATIDDQGTIRRMVRAVRLDPTSLKWERFIVAEDNGRIVGIGQVKRYPGCRELGSLVVLTSHRKRGIGAQLIRELESQTEMPLYLVCASPMVPYYERYGYRIAGIRDCPAALKIKLLLSTPMRLFGIRIYAMVKHTRED